VAGRLIIYPEVTSTQDVARGLALDGEPEGTAVMAINQTGGRGRSGRVWVSPPGKNLALSIILQPKVGPSDAALLGLLTAVAVARTCEDLGAVEPGLKWPNDVLVGGRKIAGILPEAVLHGREVQFVIRGVGLNVNAEESDFPADFRASATSLLLCSGTRWDLEETARTLLKRHEDLYDRSRAQGCGFVPSLWGTLWAHKGSMLMHDGVRAEAVGIAADGALVLRTPDGRLDHVRSGEVLPV